MGRPVCGARARSSSVRAASTCCCSAFAPQFLGACGFASACSSSVRAAASRCGTGASQTDVDRPVHSSQFCADVASFVVRCASVNYETACCGSDNISSSSGSLCGSSCVHARTRFQLRVTVKCGAPGGPHRICNLQCANSDRATPWSDAAVTCGAGGSACYRTDSATCRTDGVCCPHSAVSPVRADLLQRSQSRASFLLHRNDAGSL